MSYLEARSISKSFGGVHAVRDCSFAVEEGLVTALIGPNGAGKTTVFNILNGFTDADAGSILFKDVDITALPLWRRSRQGFSRTFQLPRMLRNLSLRENLLIAARRDDDRFLRMTFGGHDDAAYQDDISRALKLVGLEVGLERPVTDLSYGQHKLFDLARAIVNPHQVLLLDEPVAGVNPVLRSELAGVMRRLRESGETVLLIEHDMDFVRQVADTVIVLDQGTVLVSGAPELVLADTRVLEAYLGSSHHDHAD